MMMPNGVTSVSECNFSSSICTGACLELYCCLMPPSCPCFCSLFSSNAHTHTCTAKAQVIQLSVKRLGLETKTQQAFGRGSWAEVQLLANDSHDEGAPFGVYTLVSSRPKQLYRISHASKAVHFRNHEFEALISAERLRVVANVLPTLE